MSKPHHRPANVFPFVIVIFVLLVIIGACCWHRY
ncbi:MAG: sporulation protein YjcZ [Bacillus sp. (in: Bacteria)]|nr:sporulation protein YjcZ [Bacillus sp. (in: firmicutes)]